MQVERIKVLKGMRDLLLSKMVKISIFKKRVKIMAMSVIYSAYLGEINQRKKDRISNR